MGLHQVGVNGRIEIVGDQSEHSPNSVILPSPNRICKMSDNTDYVNHIHLHAQTIPLYPASMAIEASKQPSSGWRVGRPAPCGHICPSLSKNHGRPYIIPSPHDRLWSNLPPCPSSRCNIPRRTGHMASMAAVRSHRQRLRPRQPRRRNRSRIPSTNSPLKPCVSADKGIRTRWLACHGRPAACALRFGLSAQP
jgi:hypothetical protein